MGMGMERELSDHEIALEKTYWMLNDYFDLWGLCKGQEKLMRGRVYFLAEQIVKTFNEVKP